jgi:succinate dehydrogenase/fumarate reductase cytochrome b subunit
MKKTVKIISGVVWALPFLVFAQDASSQTYLSSLIQGASNLLNQLVVVLISLAVVWFIWNVVKYTMSSDEDGKEKAKSQMIWGIIAIAVIVSIWGLVAILQSIFGVSRGGAGSVTPLLPH